MKTILLLLLAGMFASCNANDQPVTNEMNMRQDNLIELVTKNDLEGMKKALAAGANVNTRDNRGRTLLLLATIDKQTAMATLLAENGADANLQDDIHDSPFLYAGATGQTELVKIFLARGARFDIFNRYNGTALIPACERGHVETVKVLVGTKGFPVNHVNRLGWTALMEAIVLGNGSKKYQEIVQILKDGGADVGIPDHDGVTPLQHARNRGFAEIVKILE
ncbi:ankyrin repeat domain-containing protein [Dyadobacter fermentans]|uniref:Ankyrin n=1 Tax=Dyadobacter fermentans (strain ATCC 700827 / DSM 18053 / CIP 107007 / KCTC 52180 / NS114) TaxID=471854 RepID=C6VZ27_DYAFD|nr:ankyrin repeat domain-containing protein [Dyadobacter fermentans]ACT95233.1 Ankyrin [Dyadobacter fermentans DSM 18053]